MSITVTDKEHFQRRLSERAADLNAEILASDATWQKELVTQAVERAEAYYNMEELLAKKQLWERRSARAATRLRQTEVEIVAHVRGLRPENVGAPDNYTYYGRNSIRLADGPVPMPIPFNDDDFNRYPTDAQKIIRLTAEAEFKSLLHMHPIGQRLMKLREQYITFQDRLVACATHTQLSMVWKELQEAFDIVMQETQSRQLRKVSTVRSNKTTTSNK